MRNYKIKTLSVLINRISLSLKSWLSLSSDSWLGYWFHLGFNYFELIIPPVNMAEYLLIQPLGKLMELQFFIFCSLVQLEIVEVSDWVKHPLRNIEHSR